MGNQLELSPNNVRVSSAGGQGHGLPRPWRAGLPPPRRIQDPSGRGPRGTRCPQVSFLPLPPPGGFSLLCGWKG